MKSVNQFFKFWCFSSQRKNNSLKVIQYIQGVVIRLLHAVLCKGRILHRQAGLALANLQFLAIKT